MTYGQLQFNVDASGRAVSDVPAPAQSQKPGQAGPKKAGPSRAMVAGLCWLLARPTTCAGQSRRPKPRLSRDHHQREFSFHSERSLSLRCVSPTPTPRLRLPCAVSSRHCRRTMCMQCIPGLSPPVGTVHPCQLSAACPDFFTQRAHHEHSTAHRRSSRRSTPPKTVAMYQLKHHVRRGGAVSADAQSTVLDDVEAGSTMGGCALVQSTFAAVHKAWCGARGAIDLEADKVSFVVFTLAGGVLTYIS